MNAGRRLEAVGVVVLVTAAGALALAGGVAALAGAELPQGVAMAMSTAGGLLGWLRVVVVAGLAVGVLRARE